MNGQAAEDPAGFVALADWHKDVRKRMLHWLLRLVWLAGTHHHFCTTVRQSPQTAAKAVYSLFLRRYIFRHIPL
jgi:hypothetical protein